MVAAREIWKRHQLRNNDNFPDTNGSGVRVSTSCRGTKKMRKKINVIAMGIFAAVMMASGAHAVEPKFMFRMPGKLIQAAEVISKKFDATKMTSTIDVQSENRSGDFVARLSLTVKNGNASDVEEHFRLVDDPSIFNDGNGPVPELEIDFLDEHGMIQFSSGIFRVETGIAPGESTTSTREWNLGRSDSGTKIASARIRYSHNIWEFQRGNYDRDEVYSLQ